MGTESWTTLGCLLLRGQCHHHCHTSCQIGLPHPQWGLPSPGPPTTFLKKALDLLPVDLPPGHSACLCLLQCLQHLHLVHLMLPPPSMPVQVVHSRQNPWKNQHLQTHYIHGQELPEAPDAPHMELQNWAFLRTSFFLFEFVGQFILQFTNKLFQDTGLGWKLTFSSASSPQRISFIIVITLFHLWFSSFYQSYFLIWPFE